MEQIDLTWGGYFGGIGDGSDQGDRRTPPDPFQFGTLFGVTFRNPVVDLITQGMTIFQSLLEERTGGEIDEDSMLTMIALFEDIDPTIYQKYDPYSNMGQFCDCCGKSINLLTGSYFLCYECDQYLEESALTQTSTQDIINTL